MSVTLAILAATLAAIAIRLGLRALLRQRIEAAQRLRARRDAEAWLTDHGEWERNRERPQEPAC